MSPCFDGIARTLHERGYRVGIVTNGTLLDRHAETVPTAWTRFTCLLTDQNGSMTASAEREHSGRSGRICLVVKSAAPLLPVVCMAVLTEELKGQLKEFFAELSDFP